MNVPMCTDRVTGPPQQVQSEKIADIVSSTHVFETDFVTLEPTPIEPKRVNIVDQVNLDDSFLQEKDEFMKFLYPLLHKNEYGAASVANFCKQPGFGGFMIECAKQDERIVEDDASSEDSLPSRFRGSHLEKWSQRYRELVKFRKEYGHCLVPLEWPKNPSLAHWVKRQRCQYKVKVEGKHSTLTDAREMALEKLGFIWDSHRAAWEERLNEITVFRELHGHCNVPSKYPENPQLAIWVKCQRRQYKLFGDGKRSNMTKERIAKLSRLGFEWTPRKRKVPTDHDKVLRSCDRSSLSFPNV